MKLDYSLLHGPKLCFGSDQLPSLLAFSKAEDDVLSIPGSLEALNKASLVGTRGTTVKRQRRNFDELAQEYGSYFNRAYRMSYDSFMKLHGILDSLLSQHCRLRHFAERSLRESWSKGALLADRGQTRTSKTKAPMVVVVVVVVVVGGAT